jgi:hypothetical protein
MKLLFTGDFYISDEFQGRDLFDASVVGLFDQADYRVVNLEAPVTTAARQNRILKTGPHLRAAENTVLPYLKKLKIDLAALANNHIMDYGERGLSDTMTSLKKGNLDTVGAGRSLRDAARPFVLERDGLRLTFLNFAENEWAGATAGRPGTNPLDIIDNSKQIEAARSAGGLVVVMIHGGHEFYPLPSPRMQKQYRFYAEKGASVVIGHHPHCPGGYEVHRGVPIFYSLGNFIFSDPSAYDDWYTGLVLSLQVDGPSGLSWDIVPVRQSKADYALTLMEGKEAAAVLRRVRDLSSIIADEASLGKEWDTLLGERGDYYLDVFSPAHFVRNRLLRSGLMKLGLRRLLIRKEHYAQILNHLRCEAHSDAARAVIGRFLDKGRS